MKSTAFEKAAGALILALMTLLVTSTSVFAQAEDTTYPRVISSESGDSLMIFTIEQARKIDSLLFDCDLAKIQLSHSKKALDKYSKLNELLDERDYMMTEKITIQKIEIKKLKLERRKWRRNAWLVGAAGAIATSAAIILKQ